MDDILARYLEEFAAPCETVNTRGNVKESAYKYQAKILRSLIRYLKRKSGGLAQHSDILSPLILELESVLTKCSSADFMFLSETISLAKKHVTVVKGEYAGGFKRRPNAKEIAQAKALLASVEAFKSEDTEKPADAYSYD